MPIWKFGQCLSLTASTFVVLVLNREIVVNISHGIYENQL